jgi:hypothetical protein
MVRILSYFRTLTHVLPCLVYNDSAHGAALIMLRMLLKGNCLCTLRALEDHADLENGARFTVLTSSLFNYCKFKKAGLRPDSILQSEMIE